jgi:hypothetical protein
MFRLGFVELGLELGVDAWISTDKQNSRPDCCGCRVRAGHAALNISLFRFATDGWWALGERYTWRTVSCSASRCVMPCSTKEPSMSFFTSFSGPYLRATTRFACLRPY